MLFSYFYTESNQVWFVELTYLVLKLAKQLRINKALNFVICLVFSLQQKTTLALILICKAKKCFVQCYAYEIYSWEEEKTTLTLSQKFW